MSNILESAIAAEGGVCKLAAALGVRQSVVSNWRARGLPRPWEIALSCKYAPPAPAKRKRVKAASAKAA